MEKRFKVFHAVLLAGLFVIGCGGASTLKLMSKVVHEDDKASAVDGARVQVLDETGTVVGQAVTDAAGNFQIQVTGIDKNKRYELVVEKELVSEVARQNVNVAAKPAIPGQIALPIMGAIKGTIFEAGKTAKDPQARVIAAAVTVMRSEMVINETTSGNDGAFTVGRLDSGKYKFRIDHPQYYPAETNYVDINKGRITPFEIPLEKIPGGDVSKYRELKNAGEWKPVQIAPVGGSRIMN